MVGLPSGGGCWGLVEVYEDHGRFDDERARIAARFAARTGSVLERLEAARAR
jgi:GAF domain-containing protein